MSITNARYVVTPEQTGMVMAFANRELIADAAMPVKKLRGSKTAFTYLERDIAQGFTVPSTLVGRASKPNRVSFTIKEQSGKCDAHGLSDVVPQEDIDEADGNVGDLVSDSLQATMNLVLLGREKRVADIVQKPSNYLSDKVTEVEDEDKFDNPESNPLTYLLERLESCIVRPNRMIINQAAWTKLRTHPKIVKAVHGNAGDSGAANRAAVADLLELKEIIVGASFINEVKKGKEPSIVSCWNSNVALHYYEPMSDGKQGLAWGMTMQSGERYAVAEWNSDLGLKGGYDVKVGAYWAEIVTAKGAGMLLTGVIS